MRFSKWVVLLVSLILFHVPGVWADSEDLDFLQYKEGECDLKKAEAQAREMSGWTTITLAVLNNDIPKTKALLEAGADINTTDTFHRSLLLLACMHDLDDMARFLVERGADVNTRMTIDVPIHTGSDQDHTAKTIHKTETRLAYTAFSKVLAQKDFAMADLFLKNGASINCLYEYPGGSHTPLFWAVETGQVETARFLLERGANPLFSEKIEQKTRCALWLALERGNPEMVRSLYDKCAAPVQKLESALGIPPLHLAARSGSVETLQYLLSKGIPVNHLDRNGQTALVEAVLYNYYNHPERILKPEQRMAVIQFLVQNGASIQASDPANRLLLSGAISTHNEPMVRFLLEKGYNPREEIQTQDNGTTLPLVYAVTKGDLGSVKALIAAGADPQWKSNSNRSLLDIAHKNPHPEMVTYFEDLLQVKPEAKRPPLEVKKERKVIFTSRSFDKASTETAQINLNQYKLEEETISTRRGEKKEREKRKVYYYLVLKDNPEPILMDASELYETGSRDPYCDVKEAKLKWLQKGHFIRVTWTNRQDGSGGGSSQMTLLLRVQGSQIETVFHDEFQKFMRNGSSSKYLGEEEWSMDSKSGDILLTRTETHEEVGGDNIKENILGRVHYEEEGTSVQYFAINSTKKVYRLRLEGTKVNCVSAKQYYLKGNELPLVNIATSNGVSYKRLCTLNPSQKGRIFCNGTLYVGETKPFKPTLQYMREIFPREGEWGY